MPKAEIKGLAQLERKLGRLPSVIDEAARQAVKDEAHETAQDERRLAPRRTGDLADSVQTEFDKGGLGASVHPTARYASFVNNGARGIPPQPFATAAGKLARRRFKKRTIEITNEALRRLGRG